MLSEKVLILLHSEPSDRFVLLSAVYSQYTLPRTFKTSKHESNDYNFINDIKNDLTHLNGNMRPCDLKSLEDI